jgi:hypothetical protein
MKRVDDEELINLINCLYDEDEKYIFLDQLNKKPEKINKNKFVEPTIFDEDDNKKNYDEGSDES